MDGATVIDLGIHPRMRNAETVYAGDVDESLASFNTVPTSSGKGYITQFYTSLLKTSQGRKLVAYMLVNFVTTVVLFIWCHLSNSMAMTALTYITVFDFFYLMTSAVTTWSYNQRRSVIYSFGYERFEVLAVFASTMLAQLGSFFIFKESVESIFEHTHHIHTGRLPLGVMVALIVHTLIIYGTDNVAFQHVIHASSSSWLQEHVTDMSENLCHVIPGLSKILLPRINPLTLLVGASSLTVLATYLAIDLKNYNGADTAGAICIAVFTIGTMFPMSAYTGKILLQTTPSHVLGQLDKCLREACTLDGVLEFRNEHFWTMGFGKMAGSVHVRVRRDANDQLVLAHVYNRLAGMVHNLTVQVFKDDWSRATAYQIIQNSSIPSVTPIKSMKSQTNVQPDASFLNIPLNQNVPWTSTPFSTPTSL